MNEEISARTVMERCDILGGFSEEPDCLTRPFASQAMRRVNEAVTAWMHDAGMTVQQDAVGNLIGRYEAFSAGAKTLLLGSHLDSVRNAGKYDGPLGVMIALACVERLHQRQERLPFAIEVLGFADEEGLRYQSAYLGSRAMTGTFDVDALQLTDADGIPMAEAIRAFGGNPDPRILRTPRWQSGDLLGYCEIHIEQGPVLEARGLPLGVVSAIAGMNRISVQFTGEAGHAGTVPMELRHDALFAAAEFVQAVETIGRSIEGLVATVGQLSVRPGASNVIPAEVTLSLDVRHQDDSVRKEASRHLEARAREAGQARGVTCKWQLLQEHAAVSCSPRMVQLLGRAIEESGYPLLSLPSGAGHDAAILSELTATGMLFVRCRGGISHNPAESVMVEDVAAAIKATERFLSLLAQEGEQ
ncbi:MAG TPA: allantoate amidohydrolase [Ktedonobacteraceae bacterium]|jgi:allantoate deiminase|nr:allantoate amidohydrolase [Ktedonobacteraceae bacterium]